MMTLKSRQDVAFAHWCVLLETENLGILHISACFAEDRENLGMIRLKSG